MSITPDGALPVTRLSPILRFDFTLSSRFCRLKFHAIGSMPRIPCLTLQPLERKLPCCHYMMRLCDGQWTSPPPPPSGPCKHAQTRICASACDTTAREALPVKRLLFQNDLDRTFAESKNDSTMKKLCIRSPRTRKPFTGKKQRESSTAGQAENDGCHQIRNSVATNPVPILAATSQHSTPSMRPLPPFTA